MTATQELTIKQAESIIPDASARQNALNFLLGVGLLQIVDRSQGSTLFSGSNQGRTYHVGTPRIRRIEPTNSLTHIFSTKDLSGEENLVLGHIKSSNNEGMTRTDANAISPDNAFSKESGQNI